MVSNNPNPYAFLPPTRPMPAPVWQSNADGGMLVLPETAPAIQTQTGSTQALPYPPLPAQFQPYLPNVVQIQSPAQAQQAQPVQAQSPEITAALQILGNIQNLPEDEAYMESLGVNILFHNGQEALDLIRRKNIQVVFGDMGDSLAHAQWLADQNVIMINQKYQGDTSPETLYAISEAIYHEAGHASRLGDDQSSLQEEIDCLALNTLAYSYHTKTNPEYAQAASQSRLIQDGVALYFKLFFDSDPSKAALVHRIIEKYGDLSPETPDNRIPIMPYGISLTDRVLRQEQVDNYNAMVSAPALNLVG